jgi:metal-responsive CopG/Arc/MetJ family transcriptional regulator
MSVINFSVTKPLERDINKTIKKDGFSSKAEFFRFAAKDYINRRNVSDDITQEEFEREMNDLAQTISRKLGGKKLPSLEEQLADL